MNWQKLMDVDEARDIVSKKYSEQPYNDFKPAPEIIVAVMDSGCDVNHKALVGVLKSSVSYAKNVQKSKEMLPDEKDDHGTLSAGLVAGVASEENDFLGGVAQPGSGIDVQLIAARYNESLNIDEDINALLDLSSKGAHVISNSYGWGRGVMKLPQTQALGKAIVKLAKQGTICVYAAGNDGKKIPDIEVASMDQAILVAATVVRDEEGEVFSKVSNFAAGITVCAPGGDSTGERPISTSTKDKYAVHGNTSAACPMVAGVIALMLSVKPGLTPARIKEILCLTADKIDADCKDGDGKWSTAMQVFSNKQKETLPNSLFNRPYSKRYGFGRVNAKEAVKEASK